MVNIEYELCHSYMLLHDANILLSLGAADPPDIEAINGLCKHDPKERTLCWHQDVVDSNNATGSLEFAVPGADADAFFPIRIFFSSQTIFCLIEVADALSITD